MIEHVHSATVAHRGHEHAAPIKDTFFTNTPNHDPFGELADNFPDSPLLLKSINNCTIVIRPEDRIFMFSLSGRPTLESLLYKFILVKVNLADASN